MNKFFLLTILFFLVTSTSCTEQERLPDLSLMESLLKENPDSLAYILEEEIIPETLSDKDKMEYAWWLCNAHHAQNRSLINDSLIHNILKIEKEKQSSRLFTTYTLAASQANWTNNIKLREQILLEGIQLAREKKDTTYVLSLCNELGRIYEKNKDLDKIKQTLHILKQYKSKSNSTEFYSILVNLYNKTEELDSVAKYSKQGIGVAIEQNQPQKEYDMTRYYVTYLNNSGQSTKALQTLSNIKEKYKNENVYGNEIKFDYIYTFIQMGQYDSAKVYIQSFDELLDHVRFTEYASEGYLIEAVLDQFSNIIDIKGNDSKNYKITDAFNKIMDNNRKSQKNEIEIFLAQQKLETDKLNMELEQKQSQEVLLYVSILIIIIVSVVIFIYQRKLLKKELSLKKIKEELFSKTEQINRNEEKIFENEQLIDDLNSQILDNDDIRKEIDKIIVENDSIKDANKKLQNEIQMYSNSISEKNDELNYLQNISLSNTKLKEQNQYLTMQLVRNTKILNELSIKPKYIDALQWIEIIHAVDQIFDNYSVRLHLDYPNLTDEDIKYCCLFKLQLGNNIISSLMGISPSSVTKRKQRIKEKMNQN